MQDRRWGETDTYVYARHDTPQYVNPPRRSPICVSSPLTYHHRSHVHIYIYILHARTHFPARLYTKKKKHRIHTYTRTHVYYNRSPDRLQATACPSLRDRSAAFPSVIVVVTRRAKRSCISSARASGDGSAPAFSLVRAYESNGPCDVSDSCSGNDHDSSTARGAGRGGACDRRRRRHREEVSKHFFLFSLLFFPFLSRSRASLVSLAAAIFAIFAKVQCRPWLFWSRLFRRSRASCFFARLFFFLLFPATRERKRKWRRLGFYGGNNRGVFLRGRLYMCAVQVALFSCQTRKRER